MKIKKGIKRILRHSTDDVNSKKEPARQVVIVEQHPADPSKRLLWILGRCILSIVYVLLFLLSSIGATALVNQATREMLWHLFFQ